MTWGNSANVVTTNLDDATDDPSLARIDILNAFYELQAIIGSRNTANGVCPLDANNLVPAANLPDSITSSSTNSLFLVPNTKRVVIQDFINLTSYTVAGLNAFSGRLPGDVAHCSNGAAGSPCLAYWNGTSWLRIAFGAAVSAT
jgi:hypothetical protein